MPSSAFSPAPAVISRRSDPEVEKMSTPHLLDLRSIARALGGEISGRQILAPGPGHRRFDRSLSIRIEPGAPDGFLCHSFAGDDPIVCKNHVRQRLGLPEWKPGHDYLKGLGVTLIPASAPDFFTEDTPTAVLVRQVLGAIAQFEKTSLVAMLKAARDRKKAATGKCGGRKTYAEARPDVVLLAKQMQDQGMSLRKISAELAARGFVTAGGRPYVASAVQTMLG
jgi:hypothetical protein